MINIRKTPERYESKFADFIRMCADAKAKGVTQVVVACPSVIGDDYDEVMENLSRLADNGLELHIVNPMAKK